MSTSYSSIKGDTFSKIAAKKYGDSSRGNFIAQSNPSIFEPITVGSILFIPDLPNVPKNNIATSGGGSLNDVVVYIRGQRFRFWTQVRILRSIDVIDTIELVAPFDIESIGFKESFRPLSYDSIVVSVGGSPLFTGTMVHITPVLTDKGKIITVSGYGLAGVLGDCNPPSSMLNNLEFRGQGLSEIAQTLASPFGVPVVFDVDQGAIFDHVACGISKKALVFLTELAKQRNLITASTVNGALLFHRESTSTEIKATFNQGEPPLLSVNASFYPQEYYSSITGVEPEIVGIAGSKYTVKNDRLIGVIRPLTIMVTDSNGGDLKTAVDSSTGRMFGNTASYQISVSTWRDSNGALWEPNTLINLKAPDALVYNEYTFLIRAVEFEANGKTEMATIDLVLTGSFSGKIPESLPWDA